MIITFAPEPRAFPEAKDIVAKFKTAGYDPEGYTLYTYAAFQMWKAAAEGSKSLDPKAQAAWLRAGNPVKTVLGELKLDKKGDLIGAKYVWYVFHKGNYAEDDSIQ
jgi:branched-chain amino acid transport system substrate-binding protein